MIELHDADAEAICGGRQRGNGHSGSSGGALTTFRVSNSIRPTTSISNTIIIAPQLNLAVNIAGFGSSITNGQGNVLSLAFA